LKAADFDYELSAATIFIGENGAGKSAVLDALQLLAYGTPPARTGLAQTSDGVMRLARGSELSVSAEVEYDGRRFTVARSWKRGPKGDVKKTVSTGQPAARGGLREAEVQLTGLLGGFVEAFRPGDMLGLSASKLRERLLSILPKDAGLALKDVVPHDCPPWAKPQFDPAPAEWVKWALEQGRQALEAERTAVSAAERMLDAYSEGWRGAKPLKPLQDALASLRTLYADVAQRDLVGWQHDKACVEVAELDAKTGPNAPLLPLALLGRAVVVVVRAAEVARLDRYVAERAQIEGARTPLVRDLEDLRAEHGDVPLATKADLVGLTAEAADLAGEVEALRKEAFSLEAKQQALLSPLLPVCPHCGDSLAEAYLAASNAAYLQQAEVEEALDTTCDRLQRLRYRVTQVEAGIERARLEAVLRVYDETLANLDAEEAQTGGPAQSELDRAERESSEALERARAADLARRKLDEAQERAHQRALEWDEIDARIQDAASALNWGEADVTVERVADEIQRREAELARLGAENARAVQLDAAKDEVADGKAKIEAIKLWLDRFTIIEMDLAAQTRGYLEARLTQAFGEQVAVELEDARGNPACRITVGCVDVAVLSGGELVSFLAALIPVLAAASEATFRPLVIDEVEKVSADRREAFLARAVEAYFSGQVDQVLICGCPDTCPEVDGLRVISLGESEAEEEKPAKTRTRRGARV
jgi:hypothetical protein